MRGSARALLATLLLVVITAPSYGNHNWGRYHWGRSTSPFTLKTGDNVGPAWDTHLNEAITDWNHSVVLDLDKVVGGTTGSACQPTLGRIEACNAEYGSNGWLGIAQIWATNRGHITQAVTKVNDSYFKTATYNTPAWRRLVMCQELAHDFGLDHQDERSITRTLGHAWITRMTQMARRATNIRTPTTTSSWSRSMSTSIRRRLPGLFRRPPHRST
jgi:hypothetical protein